MELDEDSYVCHMCRGRSESCRCHDELDQDITKETTVFISNDLYFHQKQTPVEYKKFNYRKRMKFPTEQFISFSTGFCCFEIFKIIVFKTPFNFFFACKVYICLSLFFVFLLFIAQYIAIKMYFR